MPLPFGFRELGIERGGGCPQNRPMDNEGIFPGNPTRSRKRALQIWGEVKFGVDGVFGAQVKGGVTAGEKIIITADAVVEGEVKGKDVRVEGEVHGGVVGRGQVWIGSQAHVKVRCHGRSLRIEPGAKFRGDLEVG